MLTNTVVPYCLHCTCSTDLQELHEHEQQQQQQQQQQRPPPTPLPPADTERLLGPAGFRGAKYKDYAELTLTRLERLGLGCSWSDAMSKARPVYGLGQRAPQAADWPRLAEAWAAWGVIWRWTQPEETCEPALSTVNPASCGIYDSQGTPVEPRSLLSRAARVSPRACWPFGCLG